MGGHIDRSGSLQTRILLCLLLVPLLGIGVPRATAALTLGNWTSPANMTAPRAQTTAVTDPATGNIYVIGGFTAAFGPAVKTVEVYDPTYNSWSSAPQLPVATRGASAEYHNGKIYVFGGFDSSYINSIQIFDIAANTWTTSSATISGWESGASAISLTGDIHLIGGETPSGVHSNQNVRFNTTTQLLSAAASLPVARQGLEAVTISGKIYVLGGYNGVPLNLVDAYDPAANTWSSLPADMPTPRLRFASGAYAGHALAAGGSSEYVNGTGPFYATFEILDTVANTWTTGPSLPEGLREISGAVSGSRFFVFGGFDPTGISPQVYAITIIPEPASLAVASLAFALMAARARSSRARAGSRA